MRTSASIDDQRPSKDAIPRVQDGFGSPIKPSSLRISHDFGEDQQGPADDGDGLQILVPVADGQGQKALRRELVGTDAAFRPGAGGPLSRDRPTSLVTETMEIPEKIPEDSAV